MPTVPVSAQADITNGSGFHCLLAMFVPDVWESAAPMNHTPGSWAGRHSFTFSVLFNGQCIVLEGHDQGPLLFHLPINDYWRCLKSNRKPNYSTSLVKANKKSLACIDDKHSIMTCGDPVSLPTGMNCTNAAHNLFIGMSFLDELKGEVAIACSMITDVFMFIIEPAGVMKDTVVSPAKLVMDLFGVDYKKMGAGAGANLVGSIVVSAATGWKEPITLIKLEAGNGYLAVQHAVSYTHLTLPTNREV